MKVKNVGQGSQYIRSARDSGGQWLDGGKLYRLTVPADPPAELFWSITLHDYATRSQIQNETNNAALSSYDDLRYNDDGSVDLYFGPAAPMGYENNWIETLPGRGWWVWFRFYSPAEAFFDKSWSCQTSNAWRAERATDGHAGAALPRLVSPPSRSSFPHSAS